MSWDGSSSSSSSSSILNCEVYDSDVSKSNDFLGNLEINLNDLNLFEQASVHVDESLLNINQGKIQLEIKLIPYLPLAFHSAEASSKHGGNITEKKNTIPKTFEWLQGSSFDLGFIFDIHI
jgi:Ca2+-dependent lipid-binding protein